MNLNNIETGGAAVIWTPNDIAETYPFLRGRWLYSDYALVQTMKRVPDYLERIEAKGGIEAIRRDLINIDPDLRQRYLVLLGVEEFPLPTFQVTQFVEKANIPEDSKSKIYRHDTRSADINYLQGKGMIRQGEVISIIRQSAMDGISYAVSRPIAYTASGGTARRFAEGRRR